MNSVVSLVLREISKQNKSSVIIAVDGSICMSLTSDIHIEPSKVTIVEGTYSCHPAMWDYYDYRVFLDIDPKTQMERILTRNGREAAEVFRNRWIPLEEIYFSSYNIRERCDDSFVMKE